MIEEIRSLLDKYLVWLKDKTTLRQVADWIEITTPYLDRHNDYLQIYATRKDRGYILTDDGYTIEDLEQAGCKLESPKRQDLLKTTLNGFGVSLKANALEIHASPENFALRKHNLIQAMLAVNDMFYLAHSTVSSLFHEDVTLWFDDCDIRYTPKVKFTGKSGFDHLFDFVIPKSRRYPERIVQAINRPTRNTAQAVAFAWIDTKEVRPRNSQAYALLNDSEQPISTAIYDALNSYDVTPISWGNRDSIRNKLAA